MSKKLPIITIITGLLIGTIPMRPVNAREINQYYFCASLLTKAGISDAKAASSCAEALYPNELHNCVTGIKKVTPIPGNEALSACQRVRRPLELGYCVSQINYLNQENVALSVLDYCRRSLLPKQFAQCVVGLRKKIKSPTTRLMEDCISANDSLKK